MEGLLLQLSAEGKFEGPLVNQWVFFLLSSKTNLYERVYSSFHLCIRCSLCHYMGSVDIDSMLLRSEGSIQQSTFLVLFHQLVGMCNTHHWHPPRDGSQEKRESVVNALFFHLAQHSLNISSQGYAVKNQPLYPTGRRGDESVNLLNGTERVTSPLTFFVTKPIYI
jgi:hypothetical protein